MPRLSLAQACAVLGQVSAAVSVLHGLSPPVAHRDLKPENVLLADDG